MRVCPRPLPREAKQNFHWRGFSISKPTRNKATAKERTGVLGCPSPSTAHSGEWPAWFSFPGFPGAGGRLAKARLGWGFRTTHHRKRAAPLHGGLWLAAVSSEHRTRWLFLVSDVGSSRTTDTKLPWFTSSNAPSNVIGDQDDQNAQLVIAIIIIILY